MLQIRRFLLLVGVVLAAVCRLGPTLFAAEPGTFEAEVEAFGKSDLRNPPSPGAVVFTGSSSIRLWPRLPATFPEWTVLNRGFGGSAMADLVRFQDRLVNRYRPSAVVVYEGDNDLSNGAAVDAIVLDYVRFLDRLEQDLPGTPVILLAVKPSPQRRALLAKQRELNARIVRLAGERRGVHFVDTFTPMLDAAGEPDPRWFQSDGLHLNQAGYERWIPLVRDRLQAAVPRP